MKFCCAFPEEEPQRSVGEKLSDGKDMKAGIAGSTSIRDERYEPYEDGTLMQRQRKHRTTRSNHDV